MQEAAIADPRRGVAEKAELFDHGDRQAVDLPEGVRFDGAEVLIRRDGSRIILEPVRKAPRTRAELDAMWARIDALGDDADPFPDPPPQTITPIKSW